MGRIKTKLIKRISREIFDEHSADIHKDFKKNKEFLSRYEFKSKKLRNIIAGALTRLKQREIVV
jgi:ribosomal protein S17E